MGNLYRNRSKIAKITLASVLVFLFIAISYKIFGVHYSEGSYQEGIIRNTLSIDNSMPEKSITTVCNHSIIRVFKQLPDLFAGTVEVLLKSALMFILICLTRVRIYKKDDDTLVSLCVRMDE